MIVNDTKIYQKIKSERYKNLPEDQKPKLVVYRKKYHKIKKKTLLSL